MIYGRACVEGKAIDGRDGKRVGKGDDAPCRPGETIA